MVIDRFLFHYKHFFRWGGEWHSHLEKWENIQEYDNVELGLSGLVACARKQVWLKTISAAGIQWLNHSDEMRDETSCKHWALGSNINTLWLKCCIYDLTFILCLLWCVTPAIPDQPSLRISKWWPWTGLPPEIRVTKMCFCVFKIRLWSYLCTHFGFQFDFPFTCISLLQITLAKGRPR